MAEIAEKANIEYQFHTVRDGKYGAQEGGNWNGMVGELLDRVSTGCWKVERYGQDRVTPRMLGDGQ